MKLGKKDEAIEEYSFLVANDFRIGEVLPPLMWLLLETKKFQRAGQYLHLVEEGGQKEQWEEMINSGPFINEAEREIEEKDPVGIMATVNSNYSLLYSCTAPYAFYNSARVLSDSGMTSQAMSIYVELLRYCKRDTELRAIALNELGQLEPPGEFRERLSMERERYSLDAHYMKRLDGVESAILMDMLEETEPLSDEAQAIIVSIYALSHEDEGVLARVSWMSFNRKEYDMAHEGFSLLVGKHPDNPDYALGMGYVLLAMGNADEALQSVVRNLRGKGLAPDSRSKLLELRDLALWRKHDSAAPSSYEALSVTEEMHAASPEDEAVLSMLSWERFNLKEYEKAYEGFSRLTEKYPDNADYALGLVYTLMALGRHEEALEVAESFKDKTEDFNGIMASANAGVARAAFNGKDYDKAILHFQRVLEFEPDNDEALSLIAWSHYNMGNVIEALPYFHDMYEQEQGPEYVSILLSTYERTDPGKALVFALELSESGSDEIKKALGDFHFGQGRIISAAQASPESPRSCYYNADKPRWETSLMTSGKSGDSGLSELMQTNSTLAAHYPILGGREMSFSIKHISLSSGSAEGGVFAGSYYKGIPQTRGMTTSASLVEPELRIRQEGLVSYTLALGVAPMGGAVHANPTFFFEARRTSWSLEVHQSPVRESILSYSGLEDPYGTEAWGRVVRRGFKGSLSLAPASDYVLYIEAGYDSYTGQNVMENQAVNGTIVFGKSIPGQKAELFVGGALTAMAFEKNTNHYTFGHGGYFSPQSFISLGPSIRINSRPCKTLWFDASASVSYLSHSTDSTPQYPFNQSGAPGEFEGDSFSGGGFSLKGEVRKLLAPKWSLGASFNYDKSSDYTQWQAGLGLRYLMEGRTAVSP